MRLILLLFLYFSTSFYLYSTALDSLELTWPVGLQARLFQRRMFMSYEPERT